MEKKAHRVVEFMDALFDIGNGAHDAPVVGLALYHRRLVDHSGFFHQLHGLNLVFPYLGGTPGEFQLLMEQHQSVVCVGHSAYDLRPYRLTVVLHLFHGHLGTALAVENLTEGIDFP